MERVNWLVYPAARHKYNLRFAFNIHKLSCFSFLVALLLFVSAMGEGGFKLNPNAPEFYPDGFPSYPFCSRSQMRRNLHITDPPLHRFTPTTQALYATRCTLVTFDVDPAVTNQYLYETFQQFGMQIYFLDFFC